MPVTTRHVKRLEQRINDYSIKKWGRPVRFKTDDPKLLKKQKLIVEFLLDCADIVHGDGCNNPQCDVTVKPQYKWISKLYEKTAPTEARRSAQMNDYIDSIRWMLPNHYERVIDITIQSAFNKRTPCMELIGLNNITRRNLHRRFGEFY